MLTFTCFISRRLGVHFKRRITIERTVCTLTTIKIIGVSPSYILTSTTSALNGTVKAKINYRITLMDVHWVSCVCLVMAGKRRNIILISIRLRSVTKRSAPMAIALTIIQVMSNVFQLDLTSRYSPDVEPTTSQPLSTLSSYSLSKEIYPQIIRSRLHRLRG